MTGARDSGLRLADCYCGISAAGLVAAGKGGALVLDLDRTGSGSREMRLSGQRVTFIAFPGSISILVALGLAASKHNANATPDACVYLPRRAFDSLADRYGAERIDLAVGPGFAIGDAVFRQLGAALDHAIVHASETSAIVVDQLAAALILHIARQYGGLQLPEAPMTGSLSPWQLRLARDMLANSVGAPVAFGELAAACGLSPGHFSRAFARSTGLSPQRWLTQRRITAAKDMIRAGTPLAQIALACGFSDQSHLTRAFARTVGATPARWRSEAGA